MTGQAAPPGPEVVIATLLRESGGSGVQTHVRTFRRYLESTPRAVSVLSPFSSGSPLLWPVFGARKAIRPVSRPAGVWWYLHWHGRFLELALKAHLERGGRPAVLYTQCPVSANAALQVRTAEKVIMAVHFNVSQADEWAGKGEIPRGGALFRSIRAFEATVLPQLDGIVYVSAYSRTVLHDRLPALARVPGVVIPNSVAPLGRAAGTPLADLITVGALEPRKNHAYLLEVLREAANRGHRYTLSVVGDGPDRGALEALTRRLGLADQVRFLGYHPDPRAVMGAHRLYCHPSRVESFGIALIEAMAEGLPVIAAPVGGIPEVIRPGRDGEFWPLDDAAAAADILISVLEDGPRRAAMAAEAGVRVRTEFSADTLGSKLLTFLDDLGERRTSVPGPA